MTIIKDDITHSIMTKVTKDRKDARKLVESLLEIIKSTLSDGHEVLVPGFDNSKVCQKNARIGRSPKTKVAYEISERTVVTFKPSKVFRKELNPEAN